MGRKFKQGILYYTFDVDTVLNKRIKLLFNEFDSHGYWVWSCLLSKIYSGNGYYFDISDREEFTLFASDVCKKQVSQVDEIVKGCVRRGLFNEAVFNMFNILTSDRIQDNFLNATKERRRKGAFVEIRQNLLLVKILENEPGISIISEESEISTEQSNISAEKLNSSTEKPHFSDSKVKESKEKKSKEKDPPEKSVGGGKLDFINSLLMIFCEEYETSRGYNFPLVNKGKERDAIGRLLAEFKGNAKNKDKNSEETIQNFRTFFTKCMTIKDPWHFERMSPSHIASDLPKLKTILNKNGTNNNGKPKYPTPDEIRAANAR